MLGLAKQRENARKQAKFQQALSLFNDNKLGIREIQRITGLPYGTLYRKLKNPSKSSNLVATQRTFRPQKLSLWQTNWSLLSISKMVLPCLCWKLWWWICWQARIASHPQARFHRRTQTVSKRLSRMTLTSPLLQQIAHRVHVFITNCGTHRIVFWQMRIFHAAAPELVEEPRRLVVLDESPCGHKLRRFLSFSRS